ncbi:MAG: hypothetical protein ACYCZR_02985 [Burkholderiales bacterium]
MKPMDWECRNNTVRMFNATADSASAALKRAAKVVREAEKDTLHGDPYEVDVKLVFDVDAERWVTTVYLVY